MESIRKRAVKIYIRRFDNRYFDGIPMDSWWFILIIPLFIPFLILVTLLFLYEIIEVDAKWTGDNTLQAYYWAIEDELREILKTRPNVPNKEQRRKKRIRVISENRKKTKRNLKYKRY